jgi:septal ring factor EnvC (AmiA/AmiB activator)
VELEAELRDAEKQAENAARRSAKARAKAENAARRADKLGVQTEKTEKAPPQSTDTKRD